jgi:hypothetical protein
MEVLVPTGLADRRARPPAPRPRSLRGLRIGLLDNSKPNAGLLLETVAARLAERAGAATVRSWRKPGSARAAADVDEIVVASDVVLTGSAD